MDGGEAVDRVHRDVDGRVQLRSGQLHRTEERVHDDRDDLTSEREVREKTDSRERFERNVNLRTVKG